jgi:uncharacterized Zn finger protein (UPF0148 family)
MKCPCCGTPLVIDEWGGWIWTCFHCDYTARPATDEEIEAQERVVQLPFEEIGEKWMPDIRGQLKIKSVRLRQTGDVAIYLDVYLEDEDQRVFKAQTSSFLFDLECVVTAGDKSTP